MGKIKDNLGKMPVKNHKMGPKSKLPSKYYEDRMEEIKSKREYDELRMSLDDDDKLATEATIMGKKILPPDGYLVGKITQTDNGMLVEYVEKHYKEQCEEIVKDIILKHLHENDTENIKDKFEIETPNKVNDKLEYETENIFGYKPDDIVFVNEINWVKITNKLWDSYKKEFFYKGVGLFNQKVYDNISQKSIKAQISSSSFNVNNNVVDNAELTDSQEETQEEIEQMDSKFAKTDKHNSTDRYVNDICDDILINQISNKVAIINLKSDVCDDEVELNLGDYEIEIRDNKTYAVLKKPKYPKTYEECCEIVNACPTVGISYDSNEDMLYNDEDDLTLLTLRKLLICRNAYWKIAGEEMGLGKPWDSTYGCGEWGYWFGYSINENKIYLQDSRILVNHTLVFPTEEMRDAFYENFKDLIEQCKKLL